jgi:hypothetical protein
MLKWTSFGAVETPTLLQIRVQRSVVGRVRVGAPSPSRALSTEEILSNIRHFTEGMKGPRTHPVSRMVLSGAGVAKRGDLRDIVSHAHSFGCEETTLHIGVDEVEGFTPVSCDSITTVVIPVLAGDSRGWPKQLEQAVSLTERSNHAGVKVAINCTLSTLSMGAMDMLVSAIKRSPPASISLTFPFPSNQMSALPSFEGALSSLQRVVPDLEALGIRVGIKGLPPCFIGELSRCSWRSSNRWYVDSEHQLEDALLFFPDVVSFTKIENCRFCKFDSRCDGFFGAYISSGRFPRMEPPLD